MQRLARREPTGRLDEVDPDRLARERHGARRARVRFEDVHGAVGDRELDVEEADDAERRAEPLDHVLDLERVRSVSDCAGSTQAESPEWTPASSTCCITAAM